MRFCVSLSVSCFCLSICGPLTLSPTHPPSPTVTRVDAYTTAAAPLPSTKEAIEACRAQVVTLGSPSALKAWLAVEALASDADESLSLPRLACIGSTTADAALAKGVDGARVYWARQPGLCGWAGVGVGVSVSDTLSHQSTRTHAKPGVNGWADAVEAALRAASDDDDRGRRGALEDG